MCEILGPNSSLALMSISNRQRNGGPRATAQQVGEYSTKGGVPSGRRALSEAKHGVILVLRRESHRYLAFKTSLETLSQKKEKAP